MPRWSCNYQISSLYLILGLVLLESSNSHKAILSTVQNIGLSQTQIRFGNLNKIIMEKILHFISFLYFSFYFFYISNIYIYRHQRNAQRGTRRSDNIIHSRRLVPNLSPMHALSSKKKAQTSQTTGAA